MGIRQCQRSTEVSKNPAGTGRQNAGEDSGSQTTQGEEEGKFTMSQQSGKSVEERILLEKRKIDQSSCDSGAGLRGEVRPAKTGVYLWADPKVLRRCRSD